MKALLFLCSIALVGCGKSAAPLSAQDVAAYRTCKDTIEGRAITRDSVNYRSDDTPASKNAKGQLEVSVKFSAQNELRQVSTMLARCVTSADGSSLVDIAVKESR
jgi:hypothetical protein